MASPFAFVPRKVAKTARTHALVSNAAPTFVSDSSSSSTVGPAAHKPPRQSPRTITARGSSKGKTKIEDAPSKSLPSEDYALLVCLALSDHALWSDPDLRRTIEQHAEKFIPLSYVLRNSPVLRSGQDLRAEEIGVVKALRSHASDVLEVRMIVSDSSNSWQSKDRGIYEVRRKDWKDMLHVPSREYTKDQWEKNTIYMENIPVQYRTVPGIARLTSSLLSQPGQTLSLAKVQAITLPPHHQDQPDDLPKCKGFAFVTLADHQDVQRLLEEWPWDKQLNHDDKASSTSDDNARECSKFGLRTLSKRRWDELKQEYLAYQRKLLNELVAFNEGSSSLSLSADVLAPEHDEDHDVAYQPEHDLATTNLDSPYPLNCLVFVRNIHSETNKTTLRKLFSTAFDAATAEGLDYVDFNKGMDSCYLRLASPRHSQLLVGRFTSHLTTQERGLDDTGTTHKSNDGAITMEIVQGKREELYWDKVPEKVRKQAVQKAVDVQLQLNADAESHNRRGGGGLDAELVVDGSTNAKRRKRKRDK
ncbi:hypothetical protein PILCRDRAFT_13765 [Piloderma croceum F 1598]|uniref:XRRM domain-containing protein n=1 Tax=Piloderma croceum (strain F 1598) TaxID=765440 RepID=A0A0C3F5Q8_PILCF|nr:hypothetical protein PILCRDRAFT_13765 [Piloderma croceum F 1598]